MEPSKQKFCELFCNIMASFMQTPFLFFIDVFVVKYGPTWCCQGTISCCKKRCIIFVWPYISIQLCIPQYIYLSIYPAILPVSMSLFFYLPIYLPFIYYLSIHISLAFNLPFAFLFLSTYLSFLSMYLPIYI